VWKPWLLQQAASSPPSILSETKVGAASTCSLLSFSSLCVCALCALPCDRSTLRVAYVIGPQFRNRKTEANLCPRCRRVCLNLCPLTPELRMLCGGMIVETSDVRVMPCSRRP
jgi:hypothetical protein